MATIHEDQADAIDNAKTASVFDAELEVVKFEVEDPDSSFHDESSKGPGCADKKCIKLKPRVFTEVFKIFFVIQGVSIMMPWHMFVGRVHGFAKSSLGPADMTAPDAAQTCMQVIVLAGLIPQALAATVNTFWTSKCSLPLKIQCPKIHICIVAIVMLLVAALIVIKVCLRAHPEAVFYSIVACVALIWAFKGVYHNTMFGLAALFKDMATPYLLVGTNLSGILAVGVSVAATFIWPGEPNTAITTFFISAMIVAVFAEYVMVVMSYGHDLGHTVAAAKAHSRKRASEAGNSDDDSADLKEVFGRCWLEYLCLFVIFFTTLASYPAITSNVESINQGLGLGPAYFADVTCFLTFSLAALVGNFGATLGGGASIPNVVIVAMTFCRLAFIPFFMLCNYLPHTRTIPVLVANDYAYWGGVLISGLTGGFASSAIMTKVPAMVGGACRQRAGQMAAWALITGFLFGALFSMATANFLV